MFRGQLHELAFEHWSAGRSAKAGKSDLDRVLSQEPANPDARMIMGTYLYFADLLPGVLKIASFLLRIPGGDREEGLEMLRSVESVPSFSQHDARGMRGAILFGFEGDLAAARELFDGFDADFPDNPRLVEPLAVLDLWFVERLGAGLSRIARVVQANETGGDPHALELTARLRLYQSWMEMVAGRFEDGRANLEKLHRDNPGRPDWFRPIVDLYLADAFLLGGQPDRAAAVRADARGDEKIRDLLEFVSKPGAAASGAEVEALRKLQPVARAAYEGRLEEAESLLAPLGEGPLVSFYRGEILHLRGRHADALPHYRSLLAPGVPERCRLFVRIARLRVAEIEAMQGNWETAARVFDDEVERYAVKDMLRHVVRARQRFFDREAESVRS
jgi:tetratricopeptide (TPR) repeat protein